MATLKSFKEVIVEEQDRELLYRILDKELDIVEKQGIVMSHAQAQQDNCIIDDSQLEFEFEPVKHKRNETPDMRHPLGVRTQG